MKHVLLLRGVNVGGRNRVPMPALREALAQAGMQDVESYLQSGNVLVGGGGKREQLASSCEHVIAERFGLEVAVLVRSGAELARIVRHDPFGDIAENPKLYQVSFCSAKPDPGAVAALAERAEGGERIAAHGKEIYAWFPAGVGRSKLAAQLARQSLGVSVTARNWRTVLQLNELAAQ